MLREAAVVAAVVGSVGMVGAGVASAGGWGEPGSVVGPFCQQTNGDTNNVEAETIDLGALTEVAGSDSADAYGNICGHGNDGNSVTDGEAADGEAAAAPEANGAGGA